MNYFAEQTVMEAKTNLDKIKISNFLETQGLSLEGDVEYSVAIIIDGVIVGTGSLSGRVLKSIAVNGEFQGMGISNTIVSHLVNEAYFKGNTHLFIYTTPENKVIFNDVGFTTIEEVTNKVCLMENKKNGIKSFVEDLEEYKSDKAKIASIVMNCNPFTLGHQYLIEKASAENDIVHVFIVWEDLSSFPSQIRYELAVEGTKHLSNVKIHKGGDYIISNATFPSYFIKEKNDIVETHARLDLEIFKNYIVQALNINKRYVGEEPYCPVTKEYNQIMKEVLPLGGVQVEEVKRIDVEGDYISASKVRSWILNNEYLEVKKYLPESTYNFLLSNKGKDIISGMKSESRH